jgi:hypothetical protein
MQICARTSADAELRGLLGALHGLPLAGDTFNSCGSNAVKDPLSKPPRMREDGEGALAYASHGRPNPRRLPERTRQTALRLSRTKYTGFNDHRLSFLEQGDAAETGNAGENQRARRSESIQEARISLL